jgi:hypothetical protein
VAPRKRFFGWLQLGLFGPTAAAGSPPAAPPPPLRPQQPTPAAAGAAGTAIVRVPRRLQEAVDDGAAQKLADDLRERLRPRPLAALVLTDNRSVLMSSARTPSGAVRLRLHHAFVAAPPEALAAIANFASGCRGERRRLALQALRDHVESWRGEQGTPAARRRPLQLRSRGTVHDLEAHRDALAAERFGGTVLPAITWGRWSALRGRRRTIRLGSYDGREDLIRIHPALDQPWVPPVLVRAVVYHEMLHAALPPRESGGRRCLHGPDFRRRERELPQHAEAEAWLATNLHRLLRSRRPARDPR